MVRYAVANAPYACYDAADQLVKVTDWAGRVTGYEYDKNGRLVSETRPNGTQMSRRYNVAGQLVQQVEKESDGNLLRQVDYSYDAAGNLIKEPTLPKPESVSLSPVTMTYSAANRLATYNGQAIPFDADGNLLSGPLSGEMANFYYPGTPPGITRMWFNGYMATQAPSKPMNLVKMAWRKMRKLIISPYSVTVVTKV